MSKLITYSDINKRRICTDRYLEEIIDLESIYRLYENAYNNIDSDTSYSSINNFFNSCKNSSSDSFIEESLNLIRKSHNDNLSNYIVERFSDVMSYIKDIKGLKNMISNSDIESKYKKKLLESANVCKVCDRVLNNEEEIFKRFNLDKFIRDRRRGDLNHLVFESCSLIDTYNLPNYGKLNVALEMLSIYLQKYGKEYDMKDLVESTVEYFLLSSDKSEETIKKYNEVLRKNYFINENSISGVYLTPLNEANNNTIEELIKSAEADPNLNPDLLNKSMIKIVEENHKSLLDIIYAIFNWIGKLILIVAITPAIVFGAAIGLIVALVDIIPSMIRRYKMDSKRILEQWDKEINRNQKLLKKEKDPDKIKAYNLYIDELTKGRRRLYIEIMSAKQESLKKKHTNEEVIYHDYLVNNIQPLIRLSENILHHTNRVVRDTFKDSIRNIYIDNIDKSDLLEKGYIINSNTNIRANAIDKAIRKIDESDNNVLDILINERNNIQLDNTNNDDGIDYFNMVISIYEVNEEYIGISDTILNDLSDTLYEICSNYNKNNPNMYCYYERYNNQLELHLADRRPIYLSLDQENIRDNIISPLEEYYVKEVAVSTDFF